MKYKEYMCWICNHKFVEVDVHIKKCPKCHSTNLVEMYWKTMFGITEGSDYGKYEYKAPMTIKSLIDLGELMASRNFGMWGIEDLYGIRGNSGNMEYWFTVRRGSYERINWLSADKSMDFLGHSIVEEVIKDENDEA